MPGRWLLVFDNAGSHAAVRRFLPTTGNGHVLVTTQDGMWPQSERIDIPGLDATSAARLLMDAAGETDTVAATRVANGLGMLPLALAQAVAFVTATGRGLADLERMLTEQSRNMLAWDDGQVGHAAVTVTWSTALDQLLADNPESVALLRILACMDAEEIPFRLLLDHPIKLPDSISPSVRQHVAGLWADPLALDRAIAGLRRYSLVARPSQTVSVHRLVQTVTLQQVDNDEHDHWRAAAAALIAAAVPADTFAREAWATCAVLLPHALACCDPTSSTMWRLADSRWWASDYHAYCAAQATLVDAHIRLLGPHHPETIYSRSNLVLGYQALGRYADAIALGEQMLADRKRALGRDHPDTLRSRRDLAFSYLAAGQHTEAVTLFERTLADYARVLGPDHPDALHSRGNLAFAHRTAGRQTEAVTLFEQVLADYIRVLGPDHPDTTLHSRHLGVARRPRTISESQQ